MLLSSDDTGATVHARFEPLISPSASFTTGVVATEDGSSVVEITVADDERTILIDGAPYDGTLPPTATGVVLDITDQDVRMVFPSGLEVNVLRWFTSPDFIGGVYVYAPVAMATVGALGTNNGNRADDWTVRERRLVGVEFKALARKACVHWFAGFDSRNAARRDHGSSLSLKKSKH